MSELTKLISARVPKTLHSQVKEVSDARGEDISDFVRRALYRELASLGFLSENQKKALGIKDCQRNAQR